MRYSWDTGKNEWLIRHRRISFEDIVWAVAHGHLLDVLISDKERYKGQKQLVVDVKGYAYLVPLVEQGELILLRCERALHKLLPSIEMINNTLDDSMARIEIVPALV